MNLDISTIVSVAIGGLISLSGIFITEGLKIRTNNKNKKLETRMKMFQTLEFIEKKCELLIMGYQGVGDHLELDEIPTFHLIDIRKLSEVKFLVKEIYKKEYNLFLEIENVLFELNKNTKKDMEIRTSGYSENECSVSQELSIETYERINKIISSIKDLKEKI